MTISHSELTASARSNAIQAEVLRVVKQFPRYTSPKLFMISTCCGGTEKPIFKAELAFLIRVGVVKQTPVRTCSVTGEILAGWERA